MSYKNSSSDRKSLRPLTTGLSRLAPTTLIVSLERFLIWLRGLPARSRHAWAILRSEMHSYRLAIWESQGYRIAYRTGTVDEQILAHSFSEDQFFAAVDEYVPSETDTIIDVGAHIGTFAILAGTEVPHGRVYAVEASKESYDLLCINIALNGMTNIIADHLALTDYDGAASLYLDMTGGNWGHSVTKKISNNKESVAAQSLERYFNENKISNCAFMKLNCEGAEFPIILGASLETLCRCRIILILYHSDLVEGHGEHELIEHLQRAGFAVTVTRKKKSRGWLIAKNVSHRGTEPP